MVATDGPLAAGSSVAVRVKDVVGFYGYYSGAVGLKANDGGGPS